MLRSSSLHITSSQCFCVHREGNFSCTIYTAYVVCEKQDKFASRAALGIQTHVNMNKVRVFYSTILLVYRLAYYRAAIVSITSTSTTRGQGQGEYADTHL